MYGHSTILGWEPIVIAFRNSSFRINHVQPLNIERNSRPRGMNSNASNSCVVIVSRKSSVPKNSIIYEDISLQFKKICKSLTYQLTSLNWSSIEIGIPIFANGVGLLANYSSVINLVGKEIDISKLLHLFYDIIQIKLPEFKMNVRKIL